MAKNSEAANPEKYSQDPGPISNRKCRDIFFLLLFILYWIGMAAIAIVSFQKGDLNRLKFGQDTEGYLCGTVTKNANGTTVDKRAAPFLFFFPNLTVSVQEVLKDKDASKFYQKCVEKCPSDFKGFYCKDGITPASDSISNGTNALAQILSGDCTYSYPTKTVLNRCFPDVTNPEVQDAIGSIAAVADTRALANKIFQSLYSSWQYIAISAVVALVVSMIWLLLIQWIAKLIVWLTLILNMIFSLAASAYLWFAYFQIKNGKDGVFQYNFKGTNLKLDVNIDELNLNTILVLAIIVSVITVIVWLLVISSRSRIQLAIEVVKDACKAVFAMPITVAFPIITFLLQIIVFAFCIAVIAFLSTSGDSVAQFVNDKQSQYSKQSFNTSYVLNGLIIYYWLGLFWSWNLVSAIGQCTLAGAIATWYWTRDKKQVSAFAVFGAFGRTLRYHLGSLAFGSLIIALVQLARYLLMKLESRLKKANNKAAQYVVRCLQLCFACLERFLKFLNKNAYIEIAVYGYSFCQAAKSAFQLILRNIWRVAVLDRVGDFIMFLAKIGITAFTCIIGLAMLWNKRQEGDNIAVPLIFIGIIAWVIGGLFVSVIDMAIDTVFLSFCEDCERNDGSPSKPYYMSEGMKKYVGTKKAGEEAPVADQGGKKGKK